MVLKQIETIPAYRELLDKALDEVEPLVTDRDGGMNERLGFIFLSAPDSVTPAHTDHQHNFLLQVRGSKDMNVRHFPDPRTQQLALEDSLGGGHRNVEWEPENGSRTAHGCQCRCRSPFRRPQTTASSACTRSTRGCDPSDCLRLLPADVRALIGARVRASAPSER